MDSKPFIRYSNIWERIVLLLMGPNIVLFYEILGRHSMPPHQETYIFEPTANRVKQENVGGKFVSSEIKNAELGFIFTATYSHEHMK